MMHCTSYEASMRAKKFVFNKNKICCEYLHHSNAFKQAPRPGGSGSVLLIHGLMFLPLFVGVLRFDLCFVMHYIASFLALK